MIWNIYVLIGIAVGLYFLWSFAEEDWKCYKGEYEADQYGNYSLREPLTYLIIFLVSCPIVNLFAGAFVLFMMATMGRK